MVEMFSKSHLSRNDHAVLGALFDPESSLDRCYPESLSTPGEDNIPEHLAQAEQDTIKSLNIAEPTVQDVSSALVSLTTIVDKYPTYASAYANRAQARRLLPNSLDQTQIIAEIFSDLNNAISLASSPSSTRAPTANDLQTLRSAHSHRGYLLMRASTNADFREKLSSLNLPDLRAITEPGQFEDLASIDFSMAGRYGNKTAQQLAVKTNPYAKLCGQIVKEAMQREIKEFYEAREIVY